MPRTMHPFGDRARPDPAGNVTPYDSPSVGDLLEVAPTPGDGTWPVLLTNEVAIELAPFDARAFATLASTALIEEPRKLLQANPRRAAVTFSGGGALVNLDGWRVGRTAQDVLRDESAIVVTPAAGGPGAFPLRFAWEDEVWAQQRTAGTGALLVVMTEDWAD